MMIQRSQGIYQLLLTVVPLYLITILCLSSTGIFIIFILFLLLFFNIYLIILFNLNMLIFILALGYKRKVDKTKCPHVRTYRPPLQLDEVSNINNNT